MSAKVSYFIALTLVISSFCSCLKVDDFPDEPIIEFTSLVETDEGITLNFSFTDGDGNFGLEEADTLSPFDVDPFQQNLIVDYYELQNGVWQRFGNDFPITSPFYMVGTFSQRVDWIQPSGQNKTQDGDISYDILGYFNPDSAFDTCRYEFFVYDRDLNKSNTEITSSFIKPN